MEREILEEQLSMINKLISCTIDTTKNIVTSTSTDFMYRFIKTEIKTKGPFTLKERVPLTKLQIAAFSIPVGKKGKEKKIKEFSDVAEGYLQQKLWELSKEIAKICENSIEKMFTGLKNAGKNFDSLLITYAAETSSLNTQLGSLYEIIKAKETMIPDMVIYDLNFDTQSFGMWSLTKDIPRNVGTIVPPNPLGQMRDSMTHFYESCFEAIAEYLELQISKLGRNIGEPFEKLKADLNECCNQMIDNCKEPKPFSRSGSGRSPQRADTL